MAEFDLSEKTVHQVGSTPDREDHNLYLEKDVKEFVKRLNEFIQNSKWIDEQTKRHFKANVNKLAGEKLNG